MNDLGRTGRLLIGAALCLLWIAGLRLAQYVHMPSSSAAPRVEIPRGAGLDRVVAVLHEAGLAPWRAGTAWGFRLWGKPRAVKAGIYAFKEGTRLVDVFADLEAGRIDLVTVTVPEGLTAREIAGILESHGVTAAAAFTALALDLSSPGLWGLPGSSLEGFLFPDTYRFARELPARSVAETMVRRFRQVTADLEPQVRLQGLDLLSWVTLGSLVEKETGNEGERPLVAAVLQNRLNRGMPLQSDPTVIYGLPAFDGNLRREDLRRDSPYNTYVRSGLPPGPICNPGRASLQAVLRPAPVPYLYFVSRNDGTHAFSSTYAEHERAVNRYQRGGSR